MTGVVIPLDSGEEEESYKPSWLLKNLKPQHRQICSMIVQGIPRYTIAQAMNCTPEYISMLVRQPLIIEEIRRFSEYAGLQLEAQFTKVVDAIGDTLENGDYKARMTAARLQSELTGRIGSRTNPNDMKPTSDDRLLNLSERLVGLLENKMADNVKVEAHALEDSQELQIQDADFSDRSMSEGSSGQSAHEPTQNDGGRLSDS